MCLQLIDMRHTLARGRWTDASALKVRLSQGALLLASGERKPQRFRETSFKVASRRPRRFESRIMASTSGPPGDCTERIRAATNKLGYMISANMHPGVTEGTQYTERSIGGGRYMMSESSLRHTNSSMQNEDRVEDRSNFRWKDPLKVYTERALTLHDGKRLLIALCNHRHAATA